MVIDFKIHALSKIMLYFCLTLDHFSLKRQIVNIFSFLSIGPSTLPYGREAAIDYTYMGMSGFGPGVTMHLIITKYFRHKYVIFEDVMARFP